MVGVLHIMRRLAYFLTPMVSSQYLMFSYQKLIKKHVPLICLLCPILMIFRIGWPLLREFIFLKDVSQQCTANTFNHFLVQYS